MFADFPSGMNEATRCAREEKKKTNLKVSLETEAEHRTHARHDAT